MSELKVKEKARIISVNIKDYVLKRKILEMGLVKDTIVCIKKIAPFNDPICVEVRDYELCLRKKDISNIEVLKI